LEQFYRDRLARATGRPLLGEALPWLFGDFLGVTHHKRFSSIARAWLGINYSIMMADDVLDRPATDVAALTLTSLLLLQRGLCDIFSTSRDRKKLKCICDDSFSRCASAAYAEEQLRKQRTRPGIKLSLRVVERKFAVAEVCFAVLSELAEPSVTSARIRHVKEFHRKLILGLQMLDDLSDWAEDLENGHFTYLLARGVRQSPFWRKRIQVQDTIGLDLSFILLVQTGAITETLSVSRNALAGALCLVSKSRSVQSTMLVDILKNASAMIDEASNSSELFRRKLIASFPVDRPLTGTAAEIIKKANVQREYVHLQRKLIVISQHS
jgi:hypothetical protein